MSARIARARRTLDAAYFQRLYAADPDPWRFASSAYERAKYDATLAALPRSRYRAAFEIGCSIGVLTRDLAQRCERLLAVDLLPEVLAHARARCHGLRHVAFARMAVPDELPSGRFDLIVLSEVGYYLAAGDLARLADFIAAALLPQGHLVMVHWTGATDYPLSGDQVHDTVLARSAAALAPIAARRQESYRLDVLARRSAAVG